MDITRPHISHLPAGEPRLVHMVAGTRFPRAEKESSKSQCVSAFQGSVYVMLAIVPLAKTSHKASLELGHEGVLKIIEGRRPSL